jgi:transposase-like protein
MAPRFTEEEARKAIAESRSWAESLRRLGYCHTGANPQTLKKWAGIWAIDTDHFDGAAVSNEALQRSSRKIPLAEVLVEGSTYNRSHLKRRLYEEGLKKPECELCGQGEIWRGSRMSLILDHINGDRTDNRLENLRIVCPNCAATLDTHCGGNKRGHPRLPALRDCALCGSEFSPKYWDHRYCSRKCGTRARSRIGVASPKRRKIERPPHQQLLREVLEMGYRAVGRRYGVSDTAIRKWLRQYEREIALSEGRDPKVVQIPTRTWPNRKRNRKAA